jgi:hypothetical protein
MQELTARPTIPSFAMVCGVGLALAGGPATARAETVPARVILLRPGERAVVLAAGSDRRVFRWQGGRVSEVSGVVDPEGGQRFTLPAGEYTAYDMFAGHSRNREKLIVRWGGGASLRASAERPAVNQREGGCDPRSDATCAAGERRATTPGPARAARMSITASVPADWVSFCRAIVDSGRLQLGPFLAEAQRDRD